MTSFCTVLKRRSSQFVILTILFFFSVILYVSVYKNLNREVRFTMDVRSNEFFVAKYEVQKHSLDIFGYFKDYMSNRNDSVKRLLRLTGVDMLLNKLKSKRFLSDETIFHIGRNVEYTNCFELFNGNELEMNNSIEIDQNITRVNVGPNRYIKMTENCKHFIRNRNYITEPLTEEENEFPIAYSILMYTDIEQFERLLRAIYRPQNSYCIHVDLNSKEDVFKAVSAITNCFSNIYMAPKRVHVKWGEMSVLEPELICMKELWTRNKLWKYFINLTGQEFPLKTNYELVQILSAYNGANDMEGTRKRANKDRWENKGNPPHGIIPTKGSVHVVVCRDFVEFVLFDQKAQDLLKWVEKTSIPDETFFASINHNPHLKAPGSYKGNPETDNDTKPFLTRFKNWGEYECKGKYVRGICIFGVGDLPMLASRKEMFANKFMWDYQRTAYTCLEELLYNRTREQTLGNLKFDASWYGSRGFVLNKV